jgi:hypothetical protein
MTKARQRERARRRLAERQALGIAPTAAHWLLDKIENLRTRRRLDDALEECEKGLRRFGPSCPLLVARGMVFMAQDRRAKAAESFGAAVELKLLAGRLQRLAFRAAPGGEP